MSSKKIVERRGRKGEDEGDGRRVGPTPASEVGRSELLVAAWSSAGVLREHYSCSTGAQQEGGEEVGDHQEDHQSHL